MTKTDHPLRLWRNRQSPRKTLSEVAQLVEVTPSHLSEIENWKNEPSLDLASKLAALIGADMREFVRAEVQ